MPEYIEREAALNVCEMHYQHCLMMHDFCGDTTADNIKTDIGTLPAADVVEVRHGEWEGGMFTDEVYYKEQCSICGEWSYDCGGSYCPYCGSKMDGKGEGECG
jgi:hypothetical protein